MSRLRPYLIRAAYEWILDHDLTPYILIDAEHEGSEVPHEYVESGKIVLNISPVAVQNLQIEDDYVGFEASFSGQAWQVFAHTQAVLAVYASETGQGVYARESGLGMLVNEGEEDELDPNPNHDSHDTEAKPVKKGGPNLRIVK